MLNGIGGRTIAEAKARMSYAEFTRWRLYLQKRGTMHQGMRTEGGFALLATLINRSHGGKAEMEDFMPHHDKAPMTLAQAMKAWN